jgi:hypothetical protein
MSFLDVMLEAMSKLVSCTVVPFLGYAGGYVKKLDFSKLSVAMALTFGIHLAHGVQCAI